MDNKKKKDVLIIVMLIAVVCMSGAFAMLSSKEEAKGTGVVEGNWDVKITNVVESATQGAGLSESAVSELNVATFNASLYQPGDSVTYLVTVENNGNIDAKLDSITSQVTPNYGTDDNPYVVYTYDGITSESILKAGESITFAVMIQYSTEATTVVNLNASLTTILNYIQNV
ncbi:MAG: hypothetical protein IJN90_00145 [Bacilli bacterium]|nr:hypothetical protein [Bacilli bacterium]